MIARLLILSALTLLSFAPHAEINTSDPYALIEQVGEKTFSRVRNDLSIIEQDSGHYRVIVADELMPYIDYKYAALKALGKELIKQRHERDPLLRKRNKEALKRYVQSFKGYLVNVYAGVFTQYTDQTVIYQPSINIGNRKIAIVKATIKELGKPDIELGFKLRKQRDNSWAAFDMLVEGISLLDAKQAELEFMLKKRNLEDVSEMLAVKANAPISFDY